ncbi:uncharacterized protein [Clytia hemisphaerica]|uniref:Uncharacterized protein n=1 Tax=Clytia hemisphaerica TaxID=252671 RepID=A0A7M5XDI8_9CNID|eukprot:TCONS_00001764-protein
MKTLFGFSLLLLAIFTQETTGLSLLPCDQYDCPPLEKLSCGRRGSYRTEVTGGCCHACFKVAGQKCGGIHDHEGLCKEGLKCVSRIKPVIPINKPVGICRRPPQLPRKWEALLKSGKVTFELRVELNKLFQRIRKLNEEFC